MPDDDLRCSIGSIIALSHDSLGDVGDAIFDRDVPGDRCLILLLDDLTFLSLLLPPMLLLLCCWCCSIYCCCCCCLIFVLLLAKLFDRTRLLSTKSLFELVALCNLLKPFAVCRCVR